MLRRPRRLVLGLLPVVLCLALVSCGDDTGSDDSATTAGLKAVEISGAVGSAPDVTWKSEMSAGKITATTVDKGDGAALADGDQVLTQIWIGNGFTKKKAFSSYDESAPELLTAGDEQLSPVFADAIDDQTIGSRVAVTASAEEAFGATGNPSLGIGNKDTVLVIVDLVSAVASEPSGTRTPAPAWMPSITFAKGMPTAFDFTGVAAPTGQFRKATLLTGDGAVVKKGQTIVVNYLGQVYGGAAPFDESYSKGTPATFGIGTGKVIPGWDKALVGASVGSRVVLQIPPALGYGTTGNTDAGIKGTDTLFFVIDILAAG